MRVAVFWLGLVASCGRVGFSEPSGVAKPDGAPIADADPTIDAAHGVGDYTVTDTSAPYTLLVSPTPLVAAGAGGDDELFDVELPFTFAFYGIDYTHVKVAVNGYLTFSDAPTGADNYSNDCPFDTTPPDATIAVFWDDLYASPDQTPYGSIGYVVGGTPGDRTVAFEWRDLDAFYTAGTGNNNFTQILRITQTVVLHETGAIELHYGPRTPPMRDHDCGLDRHLGCSATVGLESPGGNLTKLVQCGTAAGPQVSYAPLVEGRLITFTPK